MADLNAMLVAEFGETYSDLRSTLPTNPHGPFGDFSPRPMGGIDMIAVHHTAGPKAQGWGEIAQFHVTNRQWAGIGYHIGIRGGRVSYLGDVSRGRACCMDQNHRVICVCLTGDYEREALDPADAGALMRVVDVIQRWARVTVGRSLAVKGHREVPGQQTACPGRNLLPLVHQIAGGAAPAPGPVPPPSVSRPNLAKIAWFAEDVERRMKAEGLATEAAYWRKTVTVPAIAKRDAR